MKKKADQKRNGKNSEGAQQSETRVEYAILAEELSFNAVSPRRLRRLLARRILVDGGNTKPLFPLSFEKYAINFRTVQTIYEIAGGTLTTYKDATFRIPIRRRGGGPALVVVIDGACSGRDGDTALIPPSKDHELSLKTGKFSQVMTREDGVEIVLNGNLEGSLAPIYIHGATTDNRVSPMSWEDSKLIPHPNQQ